MAFIKKRSFKHWNFTYLVNRTILAFDEYKYQGYPWLVKDANEFIENYLHDDSVCLEWGSGRSTIWFAQRVHHITSVEHNLEWYKKVQKLTKDFTNVSLYLRPLEPEEEYVNIANEFSKESLSFCLVDGRLRAQCVISIEDKIKPGGLLVVDNIERYIPTPDSTPNQRSDYADKLWETFHKDIVGGWKELMFSNGIWSTAIWVKP